MSAVEERSYSIPEVLRTYRNHQGVLDKGLKTLSYLGQFGATCGFLTSLAPLKQFGQYRQYLWALSAVRDLALIPDLLSCDRENPRRKKFQTAYLISFRLLFVSRSAMKMYNAFRPNEYVMSLVSGLGKLVPGYILVFSGYSLLSTLMKTQEERLGVQDYLSITDDVAELVCTSLEGGYIPVFGDPAKSLLTSSACISAVAGLVSGGASFVNRCIDVYHFHITSEEESDDSDDVAEQTDRMQAQDMESNDTAQSPSNETES